MKLAISNLAWDKKEDSKVLKLLHKYNVKGIEIACSKVWPDPIKASRSEIKEYRNFWEKNDIQIIATTSLLFGHPEFQLFESKDVRSKMYDYLSNMVSVSSLLGAKAMVFGSPKNRKRNGLLNKEAKTIAKDFFGKMGNLAKKYNISFAIEPLPLIYGTDFLNSTDETIKFIKSINHPNLGINFDTGSLTASDEISEEFIRSILPYTKHAHISEPLLKQIPAGETDHNKFSKILKKLNYKGWLSIEMPLGTEINHLKTINSTLEFTTSIYN